MSVNLHWPRTLASRLSLIFLIGLISEQITALMYKKDV